MRSHSGKRYRREREAKVVRDALRAEVPGCESCGKTGGKLDIHEICRGPCRQAALDQRYCLLALCRCCHDAMGSASAWPESRQLALLAARRPHDFDLTAYLALTSPSAPRRIELAEVLQYLEFSECPP